MTTPELRELIAQAEDPEWFNTVSITVKSDFLEEPINFEGLGSFHGFLSREIEGWKKFSKLPNEFLICLKNLESRKDFVEGFVKQYYHRESTSLSRVWGDFGRRKSLLGENFISSESPELKFLMDIYLRKPNSFQAAYSYFTGIPEVRTRNGIVGTMMAYEFDSKNFTSLAERRKREKRSLDNLRKDFLEHLNTAEKHVSGIITRTNQDLRSKSEQLDTLIREKDESFDKWFKDSSSRFAELEQSSLGKVGALEKLYQEKLSLEAPAKYWSKKADKYYREGQKSRCILLWILGLSGGFLAVILIISPKWIFENVFNGNATAVVRWSLIFIALLSLIAYSVKSISKVMFSAYHLARDAEERHTLTYFYLALKKDSSVTDEDRGLILQSLFSRVDTGLLKDDSGPTMPHDKMVSGIRH